MAKPKLIQWLEAETGETLEYTPEAEPQGPLQDRHLSVRLTPELAAGVAELAAERDLSMSQLVRALMTAAVDERTRVATLDGPALADRLEADIAELRRRLPF
jgi:hypothetical protein